MDLIDLLVNWGFPILGNAWIFVVCFYKHLKETKINQQMNLVMFFVMSLVWWILWVFMVFLN